MYGLAMPAFTYTMDIAATPERVWAILGDLTSVDRWVPGVVAVARTESGRVCTRDDGFVLNEQILDYSTETMSYRYVIDGSPLPVRDNTGSFAVEDADGQARVVWESSFVPLDPAMEAKVVEMWEPFLPLVLGNLKKLVESR
jgi:uncharacterized protein YndB with AHSA1/START domain